MANCFIVSTFAARGFPVTSRWWLKMWILRDVPLVSATGFTMLKKIALLRDTSGYPVTESQLKLRAQQWTLFSIIWKDDRYIETAPTLCPHSALINAFWATLY